MLIRYIYHSGFAVECQDFDIIFDYYKDSPQGTVESLLSRNDKPLYVFASHAHPDHFNPAIFNWGKRRETTYILSDDINANLSRKAFGDAARLRKGASFGDGRVSVKAFGSTDVGVSFLIETCGKTLFHAGDLNNWHWADESTEDEIADAESRFLSEIGEISKYVWHIDAAMFPVDARMGADYAKGAYQFASTVKVGTFIPMHFTASPVETVTAITPTIEKLVGKYVILANDANSVEI